MSSQRILGFFLIFVAVLLWFNVLALPLASTQPLYLAAYDRTKSIYIAAPIEVNGVTYNTVANSAIVVDVTFPATVKALPKEGYSFYSWIDPYGKEQVGVNPLTVTEGGFAIAVYSSGQTLPFNAIVYTDVGGQATALNPSSTIYLNKKSFSVRVDIYDPNKVVSGVAMKIYSGSQLISSVQGTKFYDDPQSESYSLSYTFPGDGTYVISIVVSTSSTSYTVLSTVGDVSTAPHFIKANQLLSLALALIGLVLIVKGGRER